MTLNNAVVIEVEGVGIVRNNMVTDTFLGHEFEYVYDLSDVTVEAFAMTRCATCRYFNASPNKKENVMMCTHCTEIVCTVCERMLPSGGAIGDPCACSLYNRVTEEFAHYAFRSHRTTWRKDRKIKPRRLQSGVYNYNAK